MGIVMKKRDLDLDALEAVSGGINLRTLQTHMGGDPHAPSSIGGGDPFHHAAGPQFSPFGTHTAVPGGFPNALHPTTTFQQPQVPHAPTVVQHAPAPAAHAPAASQFNPASAIQSITGLIGSLSKLGGGGSSSSGNRGGGSQSSGFPGMSGSGQRSSGGDDYQPSGHSPYEAPGQAAASSDPWSRELGQFTQQDAQNRSNGYYGAFGDAPTGPSQQQLDQFTQQDNQNRNDGYYGAFGDAPTGQQDSTFEPTPNADGTYDV